MAAIPFPTEGATPNPGSSTSTSTSTSSGSGSGQDPAAASTAHTPTAATPGLLHAQSAIGSISTNDKDATTPGPHSAGGPGPGPIPIPPPPLRLGYGLGNETHGPPSPSTLTDVILGLHATLYASKKSTEEVMQMVSRYYDNDAVFESPLLQARGREQIANQFKMAFALPGMDVQSELRDVICSDFEFDGTRAGIIDHTLTISLFPTLFGPSTYAGSGGASATGFGGRGGEYASQLHGIPRSAGGPGSAGLHSGNASSYFRGRQSVPASAGGLSAFTVPGSSYFHQMHPFTPISAAQTPYPQGGPAAHSASTFALPASTSSHHLKDSIHTFDNDNDLTTPATAATSNTAGPAGRRRSDVASSTNSSSKHPSHRTSTNATHAGARNSHFDLHANDPDDDLDPERDGETGRQFAYVGASGSYSGHAGSIAGGDDYVSGELSFSGTGGAAEEQQAQLQRPAMPADAVVPHWSASGFGRASLRALVWSLFHPRAALKALCSFQIRVMTRLEFNDNGMIVRHEDMWSVREAIEGIVPFAGLLYAVERRIVGFLVSWAVASGFTISQLLLSRAIDSHPGSSGAALEGGHKSDAAYHGGGAIDVGAGWTGMGGDGAAYEVERALLQHQQRMDRERERAPSSATHSRQPTYSSVQGDYGYPTFSRSRAPSPTRRFGSISGGGSSTNLVTGTRSRARSLISANPHLRAASSQNLLQFSSSAYPAGGSQQGHGGSGAAGASASGWQH